MYRIKLIIVLILVSSTYSFSQLSNVKINDDIYSYLSKMSQKGLIDYQ